MERSMGSDPPIRLLIDVEADNLFIDIVPKYLIAHSLSLFILHKFTFIYIIEAVH